MAEREYYDDDGQYQQVQDDGIYETNPNTNPGAWGYGYDPGPNWNGGVAPAPPSGRYDYNGGSPVNDPSEPLQAGNGWVWEGPQTPVWNADLRQWDRGVWQQRQGQGIGYTAPPTTTTPPPPPTPGPGGPSGPSGPPGPGAVPPINAPSATLPSGVTDLFNKVPEKTPIQSAYQKALLDYMGRAQTTPSLDDPILGPQAEVYRVQQQRNAERNRRSTVERAAAQGTNNSGYINRQIEKGDQEQRFNTAMYNANLLGGEMDKRRKELQTALSLASATGDNEAARELQARLAQVNAAMQQQGLNLQGQLGKGDLSLRLMQTLLGNDQFYDQLGVNTALNMEGLNQRALQLFPW